MEMHKYLFTVNQEAETPLQLVRNSAGLLLDSDSVPMALQHWPSHCYI